MSFGDLPLGFGGSDQVPFVGKLSTFFWGGTARQVKSGGPGVIMAVLERVRSTTELQVELLRSGLPAALAAHLPGKNGPEAVQLLAMVTRTALECDLHGCAWDSFLAAGGVEPLTALLAAENLQVAGFVPSWKL